MADLYLLGGADLEMTEIARLLRAHGAACRDKGLAWGARLSDYRAEAEAAVAAGDMPVAVELADDLPADWPARARLTIIDHHGPRAGQGQPTALEQVFARLGLDRTRWTRRLALVAANDRGHIGAMQAMGASMEEMRAIRAQDRAAQGVNAAMERQALADVAARRVSGRLTRVDTELFTSTPIADAMHAALGGPGYDRLLVAMPDRLALFGDGDAIARLARACPDSWWGGDLPSAGYWGMAGPPAARKHALALIEAL